MNVFRITQPEGALDNAPLDVQAIVRIVQEERRVPDIAMLELVLDELQAVESDFTVISRR